MNSCKDSYTGNQNVERILREFAIIKPTAPANLISRTFRTIEIKENTSSESFERLSWLSVATACTKASEVPETRR